MMPVVDSKRSSDYVLKCIGTGILIMICDSIFYGEIIPISGVYIGSLLSAALNFPIYVEVLLVAGCTMGLFFLVLALRLEKGFWVKLYSLDPFYKMLLHARDITNAISLAIFIGSKLTTTTAMTIQSLHSQEIRPAEKLEHPIQGWGSVVCQRLESYKLLNLWPNCPEETRSSYEVLYEANLLFLTAKIVISVGKMLYFNTLCTYLQTLKIIKDFQTVFNQAYEDSHTGHRYHRRARHRRRHHGHRDSNPESLTIPMAGSAETREAMPGLNYAGSPVGPRDNTNNGESERSA